MVAVGAVEEASASQVSDRGGDDNRAPGAGAVYVFRRSGAGWQQEAYLKSRNATAAAQFGWSVALWGDRLAIGERQFAQGVVHVLRRDSGGWGEEATLTPSVTVGIAAFGHSLALSDDTLVVGTPSEDSAARGVNGSGDRTGASTSGAVFVYRRSGTSWSSEAYLKASNAEAGDQFGDSVALAGDTLVVTATHEDSAARGVNGDQSSNRARDSGAAYVFRRSGAVWVQEAYLKAHNADAGDLFGVSVAVSSERLAVSSYAEASGAVGVDGDGSNNLAPSSGAVYLFRRRGSGWVQEHYLKAPMSREGFELGNPLAFSCSTLVAGAVGDSSAGRGVNGDSGQGALLDAGAALLYTY